MVDSDPVLRSSLRESLPFLLCTSVSDCFPPVSPKNVVFDSGDEAARLWRLSVPPIDHSLSDNPSCPTELAVFT